MRADTGQHSPQIAPSEPEFIRVAEVEKRFGIPKSTTYLLAANNRITCARIFIRPGSKRAVRVFSLKSIRALIEAHSNREAA